MYATLNLTDEEIVEAAKSQLSDRKKKNQNQARFVYIEDLSYERMVSGSVGVKAYISTYTDGETGLECYGFDSSNVYPLNDSARELIESNVRGGVLKCAEAVVKLPRGRPIFISEPGYSGWNQRSPRGNLTVYLYPIGEDSGMFFGSIEFALAEAELLNDQIAVALIRAFKSNGNLEAIKNLAPMFVSAAEGYKDLIGYYE